MAAIHGASETTSPGFDRYTELLKATAPITLESEAAVIKKDHSLSRFITAGAVVDSEILPTRIATLILPLRQLGMATARSMEVLGREFGWVLAADPKNFEKINSQDLERAYVAVGQLVSVAAKYAANDSRVTAYQAMQTLGEALACIDSYGTRRQMPLNYQKEVDALCLAADFFEAVLCETNISIGEALRIYSHLLSHASMHRADPADVVGACIDQCKFAKNLDLSADFLLPTGCSDSDPARRGQSFIGLLDYFYREGVAPPSRQELTEAALAIVIAIYLHGNGEYSRDLLMLRLLPAFTKTLTVQNLPALAHKLEEIMALIPGLREDVNRFKDPGYCRDVNFALASLFEGNVQQTVDAWKTLAFNVGVAPGLADACLSPVTATVFPKSDDRSNERKLQEVCLSVFALNCALERLEGAGFVRSEAMDLFRFIRPTVSQAAEGNLYRTHRLGSKLAMLSVVASQKGFSLEEFANEVVKPVFDTAYRYKAQQGLSTEQMMQLSRDLRWLLTATSKEGLLRLIKSGDVHRFILN